MAVPVIMPRQGQSVESCIIVAWHKKKGDEVKKGDLLFTYETDKATFEEEAPEDGVLLEVFFKEGDDVPVLTNVCVIGKEGEDTSEFRPQEAENADSAAIDEGKPESGTEIASKIEERGKKDGDNEGAAVIADAAGSAGISPRARNLAEKTGVNLGEVQGSGPQGRIIEKDVRRLRDEGRMVTKAALEQAEDTGVIEGTGLGGRITTTDVELAQKSGMPKAEKPEAEHKDKEATEEMVMGEYEDIKLTNIRKVIAQAMHHSLASTAQLTMNTSFDATSILEMRKKIKALGEDTGLSNITINDMILYAVSRVLLDFKELNSHFLDEYIRVFNNVNLGVAVDTERGLMVPTIFNANQKSIKEISTEAKALAEQCKNRTIKLDDLQGGTFTVTNLGALGIESFTPILNPPQTGILGVNGIVQRVRETEEGLKSYPAMTLSLTFDHRAVDGAPAARFLKALTKKLENIELSLIS